MHRKDGEAHPNGDPRQGGPAAECDHEGARCAAGCCSTGCCGTPQRAGVFAARGSTAYVQRFVFEVGRTTVSACIFGWYSFPCGREEILQSLHEKGHGCNQNSVYGAKET